MARRARHDDGDDPDGVSPPPGYQAPPEPWQNDSCDAARAVRKILDAFEVGEIDEPTRFALNRIVYQCDRWLKLGIAGARPGLGQERVVFALRCIVESTNGKEALTELIVRAVTGTTSEFEHHGLALVEAFDQIPLLRIVDMMRELEYFRQSDAVLALSTILRNKLRRILTPADQVKPPSKKEQLAAAKAHATSVRLKQIEHNLELGRQMAALRDNIPANNGDFARALRQFDYRDRQAASEMVRVARRYSGRRDIIEKAANWRVLVQLSSSTLPASTREAFERRIAAGEIVRANEIVVARPRGRHPAPVRRTRQRGASPASHSVAHMNKQNAR